jgi:hypothetical protein
MDWLRSTDKVTYGWRHRKKQTNMVVREQQLTIHNHRVSIKINATIVLFDYDT